MLQWSCLGLSFFNKLRGVYHLCAVKPRQTLLHVRITKQRYDKIWNSAPICLSQNMVVSKEATRQKSFLAFSTSWKLAVDGKLLLRFHDAASVGCERHALQPLAMAVVGANVFRTFARTRVCGTIWFCLVFSNKFNIMSTLSVHQSLTLPQKRDSREGWCWCKNGVSMRMW